MGRRYGGISRKDPVGMGELVQMFIQSMKLTSGLNARRVYAAWDQVSGASRYTLRRYFRDGKLYVTLNSSMARSQLYLQRHTLLSQINELLRQDELFVKEGEGVRYVEELILK